MIQRYFIQLHRSVLVGSRVFCQQVLEPVDFETGYARFQVYTCLINIFVAFIIRCAVFRQLIFSIKGIFGVTVFCVIQNIFSLVCKGCVLDISLVTHDNYLGSLIGQEVKSKVFTRCCYPLPSIVIAGEIHLLILTVILGNSYWRSVSIQEEYLEISQCYL